MWTWLASMDHHRPVTCVPSLRISVSAGAVAPAGAGSGARSAAFDGGATGPPASGILEHLVTVHDVGDLLVALAAQGRGNERQRGLTLPRCQVAEAQAIPLIPASAHQLSIRQ